MILQRLIEYYNRLRSEPEDPIPPIGFSRERIGFELLIDSDGTNPHLNDLRTPISVGKQRKLAYQSRWMNVPYRGDRSSDVKPNFLWDNSGYLLGMTADLTASEKKHEAFVDLHRELYRKAGLVALEPVVRFLENWRPEESTAFPMLSQSEDANIVFRIRGSRGYIHEDPIVAQAWIEYFLGDCDSSPGFDLTTGSKADIARIHFLIQGVRGAQSTGASLSSFNRDAFASYGMKSSMNSPVSVTSAFKYVTAARELLLYKSRSTNIGDATVIYWADRPTVLEEFVSDLFGESFPAEAGDEAESLSRAEQLRLFLSQLRSGVVHSDAIDIADPTRFFVLGLGPNAARISVRFWIDSTVEDMAQRLGQYLRDVELIGAGDGDPPLSIRRMVQATGRFKGKGKGYDSDSVSPLLAAAVSRAVLSGAPYPLSLLTAMIGRIRRDGEISHPRVAAIKACLCRLQRMRETTKEVSVGLDRERTEPAYLAGRLFAALERVQTDALGRDLNSTIKDKYFSSACATPGVVFPRLIRLNTFHLAKLDGGLRVVREKLVGEIVSGLDRFPKFLNLEEQGLFTIGYFHQRQDFFASKKSEGETE